MVCTSCERKTVYSQYQHVSVAGWEKNDHITFGIAPLKQAGTYQETVGMRISSDYPFMGLTLIIDQEVFPSQESRSDTLNCSLIDDEGNTIGQGITLYQYDFPIATTRLQEGDSLSIRIRHDMKREILPGVADIGIILTRQ